MEAFSVNSPDIKFENYQEDKTNKNQLIQLTE